MAGSTEDGTGFGILLYLRRPRQQLNDLLAPNRRVYIVDASRAGRKLEGVEVHTRVAERTRRTARNAPKPQFLSQS